MESTECLEDFIVPAAEAIPKISGRKRHRKEAREWIKIIEFEDATEAELFVKNEECWNKASRKCSSDGERIEFRCKFGKYRQSECPSAIYLLYHATNTKVSLFSSGSEHMHCDSPMARGLNHETKKIICEMFKNGVRKPNAIIAAMQQRYLTAPPKMQLVNYLKTLREDPSTNRSDGISSNELMEWCKENQNIPVDEDAVFALNYNVCGSWCQMVLSTVRLLSNLDKSQLIQIDPTHKLSWQGHSLLVFGTSDKANVFHPFGVALYGRESHDDFAFIFAALHKYNTKWRPTQLLANDCSSITDGFTQVFGSTGTSGTRLMCYAHVIKAIDKRLKGIKSAKEIRQDVSRLQACHTEEVFRRASDLFLIKWLSHNHKEHNDIIEFITYFREEWLDQNCNWYEGAAVGYPSTNAGIETITDGIKKEHTFRERLPVEMFLGNLEELLRDWSTTLRLKGFQQEVRFEPKDWAEAFQWAQSNLKILKVKYSCKYFSCTSTSTSTSSTIITLSEEVVMEHIQRTSATFDEFVKAQFGICAIDAEDDVFSCSCSGFMSKYKCKHSLGMQIRLKKVCVPPEAQIVSVGNSQSQKKRKLSLG